MRATAALIASLLPDGTATQIRDITAGRELQTTDDMLRPVGNPEIPQIASILPAETTYQIVRAAAKLGFDTTDVLTEVANAATRSTRPPGTPAPRPPPRPEPRRRLPRRPAWPAWPAPASPDRRSPRTPPRGSRPARRSRNPAAALPPRPIAEQSGPRRARIGRARLLRSFSVSARRQADQHLPEPVVSRGRRGQRVMTRAIVWVIGSTRGRLCRLPGWLRPAEQVSCGGIRPDMADAAGC